MSTAAKDTVYIDIDDEITAVIDKVQAAEHKVVALVLPKRATVFQSVVNLKLLKKAGEEAKKNIVLITSETGLLPLAGAVGLHVAKTLQSKPEIPPAPTYQEGIVNVEDEETDEDVPLDASQPIGALAGLPEEEEIIEVDNTEDKPVLASTKPSKKAINKKLKVPNFNKFRLRLILGLVGLVVLLILWYLAAFVAPKANIIVRTDTSSLTSDVSFTTSRDAQSLDTEKNVVPVHVQEVKKTDSEKTAATGEKDAGTKATGTITIRNCDYSEGFTISAGATFSGNGKNFVSTESITVPKFTGPSSACSLSGPTSGKATVDVQAQAAGDSYNVGSGNYSVPGIPSSAKVDAVGSAMSGGTTKIVKVVSQKDYDDAKKKIEDRTNSEVGPELTAQLEAAGYFVLPDSLIVGTPEFTGSPKVGEEGNEVTVTSNITYTMYGVKADDLKELLRASVKDQFDQSRQMIQSTGLDEATIRLTDKQPDGKGTATLQSIVVIGPRLDTEALKQEIAGKKRGPTEALLKAHPGVKDVDINYSPFWVFSTPKKSSKITITFEQAN